ncbi:MAG TPA: sugar phosphate nucleotidyltransferase [Polyangia bacterium]|nr:sugar phosphate nucleotidyltransferase [Polyangia bacterium]
MRKPPKSVASFAPTPPEKDDPNAPWAILLAAGRGQRLARLTRALYGRDLPKQFAALEGDDQTFLQRTMARAARLSPSQKTIVVVSEEHADLARAQLAAYEGVRIVEQPRDAGTLPGLLLPLAHVLDASPRARVVVYPSDHHVDKLAPFLDAVTAALRGVDRAPARTVLVGARADRAATDLGWIEPGHALRGGSAVSEAGELAVERFVEKPNAAVAEGLLGAGALWNTLVLALDGQTFWHEALERHAALTQPFTRYRSSIGKADERAVRREIYADIPAVDLSRDLLSSLPGLAVVEMADAGWSDCGTPERLLEVLQQSGALGGLLARLATVGLLPSDDARLPRDGWQRVAL